MKNLRLALTNLFFPAKPAPLDNFVHLVKRDQAIKASFAILHGTLHNPRAVKAFKREMLQLRDAISGVYD